MNAPVLHGHTVIAVTLGREVMSLDLSTGRTVWKRALPSGAPMANPLIAGGTVWFTLEPTLLCRVQAADGAGLFCQSVASFWTHRRPVYGGGHASAAMSGTAVLMTYQVIRGAAPFVRWLMNLPPGATEFYEQVLVSVDRSSGKVRWRESLGSGLIPSGGGHSAGTPVVTDSLGVVISPIAGNITAFNPSSGKIQWRLPLHSARGTPSVWGGLVFAGTTDGRMATIDLNSGRILCHTVLPGVPDRAGLTIVDDHGILTLRNGVIISRAMPSWAACKS
jgi:outer membrane protein assembly factor BamB